MKHSYFLIIVWGSNKYQVQQIHSSLNYILQQISQIVGFIIFAYYIYIYI